MPQPWSMTAFWICRDIVIITLYYFCNCYYIWTVVCSICIDMRSATSEVTEWELTLIFFLKGDSNYLLNFSRGPSQVRFRQGVILTLSMKKHMWVVTRSNRGETSPRGDFTSVLKTEAIFHPGINSVWFHRVTAINFHPGLIMCAIRDHLFSMYAKFSEKLIFLNPWYTHVRNVSFSHTY